MGFLGIPHFSQGGFRSSSGLGSWRNPLFSQCIFRSGRPRVLFRFFGIPDFPEPEGGTSGYSIFRDSPFLEYRKDGPRDYAGFPDSGFSAYRKDGPRGWVFCPNWDLYPVRLQVVLGYNILRIPQFVTSSRQTSGVSKVESTVWTRLGRPWGGAKCRHSISHHLQTDLGGNIFLTQDFCTPPDPFRISLCIGATG